jgi:hypothetical protein
MLDALDETLKAILREIGGLSADEVDIAFEAPDLEWAARVGKPTVNCYLYDIRENLELRGMDWEIRPSNNGHSVSRQAIPRLIDLSYVCTAWTNDIEDEHRLLWRVLWTMARCPELPRHLLQGELAALPDPITTEVAQPDGLLRDPADVWSALDNRIRPSVNVVITLPLDDTDRIEAPLVLTRRMRVHEPSRIVELIQIAGTVTTEAGEPSPETVVRIKGRAYSTVTAADGRFSLSGIPDGSYMLVAEAPGGTAEREIDVPGDGYDLVLAIGGKRGSEAAPARAGKRGATKETVERQ